MLATETAFSSAMRTSLAWIDDSGLSQIDVGAAGGVEADSPGPRAHLVHDHAVAGSGVFCDLTGWHFKGVSERQHAGPLVALALRGLALDCLDRV